MFEVIERHPGFADRSGPEIKWAGGTSIEEDVEASGSRIKQHRQICGSVLILHPREDRKVIAHKKGRFTADDRHAFTDEQSECFLRRGEINIFPGKLEVDLDGCSLSQSVCARGILVEEYRWCIRIR